MKMKISVVIPAFNEEKYIASCLNSLIKQKTKEKFEVILVDNNSTDKTQEIAHQYLQELPLKIVVEKKRGRGSARRAGFEISKGEILVSTDADCLLPVNWVQTLVDNLKNEKIAAVTSLCKFFDGPFLARIVLNCFLPLGFRLYRLTFGHYWLSGYNFAIKRWAYLKSGGFDADLNTLEDVELAFRVKEIGKIKYLPQIRVFASARRFNQGLARGLFAYVKTFIDYFWFKNESVVFDDPR